MPLVKDTLAVINRTTQAIAAWPVEEWALWVTYLLMALGKQAKEDEYRLFLEAVQQDIDTRLTEGSW